MDRLEESTLALKQETQIYDHHGSLSFKDGSTQDWEFTSGHILSLLMLSLCISMVVRNFFVDMLLKLFANARHLGRNERSLFCRNFVVCWSVVCILSSVYVQQLNEAANTV
jgi:hypothetical protein